MAQTSVYLNVSDAKRSLGFYEGLGFEVTERQDSDNGHLLYAGLEMDGAMLAIGEIAANEDAGFRAWVEAPLGAGVVVNVVLDDLGPVHERALAVGADFDEDLSEHEMGRSFILTDPDGYVIMFWEPAE